jgi:hypothetical protein
MTSDYSMYCNILYSNFRFLQDFAGVSSHQCLPLSRKITYFGHATLLINMDGARLLTDHSAPRLPT